MRLATTLAALCCAVLTSCSDSGGSDGGPGASFGDRITPNVPTGAAGSTSPSTPSTPSTASSAAAAQASDIDPCSLVTKAEADAVAGVTTRKPVRAIGLCTFATPTSGSVGQLEVLVGDGVKKYYDIDNTDLGHQFQDIAGLGDEAHLEDGAIFVRVGDVWFALRVTRLDSVDTGPALTDLARTVVGRL